MLNRRIKRKVLVKALAGAMIFITLLTGFKHQANKINQLEEDLYLKNRVEERGTDTVITQYDKDSIQRKFNTIQEYEVFNGTISMKHTYNFEEEAILGFHKKATLVGNANVAFQYKVAIANADIMETKDTIEILLDDVYLDRNTVHIVKDTFIKIEDECSKNILANYETGEKVMDYWNLSLIDKSYNIIEECHPESKLQGYAKQQVKDLVEALTDKKVIINFK